MNKYLKAITTFFAFNNSYKGFYSIAAHIMQSSFILSTTTVCKTSLRCLRLCRSSGGCSASASGGERVLPEQENQAAPGPDRGEGHSCWRNQGYERHARGQRKEDQRPAEEGENTERNVYDYGV